MRSSINMEVACLKREEKVSEGLSANWDVTVNAMKRNTAS